MVNSAALLPTARRDSVALADPSTDTASPWPTMEDLARLPARMTTIVLAARVKKD